MPLDPFPLSRMLRMHSLRGRGLDSAFDAVASEHDLIRASEIAEWCFCQRSWYLRAGGADPSLVQVEKRNSGAQYHEQHADTVKRARAAMSTATYALLLVLLFAAAYLLLTNAR
jgi:hypothetical protein